RVEDVHAAAAPGGVLALRLQRRVDARIVPVGKRVADVIDHRPRRRGRIGGDIARDNEGPSLAWRRAEGKIRAALAVVLQFLHAQHGAVEIARLAVIGARIGNVIDAQHLEAAWGCRVGGRAAGGVDGGGERNPFAEITTTDIAGLESLDEISDEPFHAVTSLLDRRFPDDPYVGGMIAVLPHAR